VLKKYLEIININKKMIEQDLKIFGANVGAMVFSIIPDINSTLQTIVLLLTIVYTILMIVKKSKE
jgi:hypothetical protein